MADTATTGTPTTGQPEVKTVTPEQLVELQSKYDKRIANLEKQITAKDEAVSSLEAELDGFKSSGSKTDPELVEMKKTLKQRELQLERERKQIETEKLTLSAQRIATEYSIDAEDLKDFKTPLEMENYALKTFIAKQKSSKPAPPADKFDRSGNSGTPPSTESYEALEAEAKKTDFNKMTPEQVKDYSDRLIRAYNSQPKK